MCCTDRDYNENIIIAKNYIKEHDKSIKESVKTTNYEYITKSKEIGISKNGYGEYVIYYSISNKPKFFIVFKTLEMAKEIANKLDEVYYIGYTKWGYWYEINILTNKLWCDNIILVRDKTFASIFL